MPSEEQLSLAPSPMLNNYSIGLVTRRFLYTLVDQGDLDTPSAHLIERVLEKSRPHNLSGWTSLLAGALGAPQEVALEAGSFVELFFSALDLIDDIQDNDANAYLGDVPWNVQINLGIHLLTLSSLAAARLGVRLNSQNNELFVLEVPRLLSRVICGQRLDLTREDWSPDTYQKMSYLSAGHQLELYIRAATFAAGVEAQPFLPLIHPLGLLLEITCDETSQDHRLTCLPQDRMIYLRDQALAQVQQALSSIPPVAMPVIKRLIRFATLGRNAQEIF